MLKNITHLTFGYCFNQKINLLNNVIHLTFGDKKGYFCNREKLSNKILTQHNEFIKNTIIPNHISIIYH